MFLFAEVKGVKWRIETEAEFFDASALFQQIYQRLVRFTMPLLFIFMNCGM